MHLYYNNLFSIKNIIHLFVVFFSLLQRTSKKLFFGGKKSKCFNLNHEQKPIGLNLEPSQRNFFFQIALFVYINFV